MFSVFRYLFLHKWQRKLLSVVIASLAWLSVSYSLSTTKIITNIPVKVLNLPIGKTIEGLQPNGALSQRISLTLHGNKNILDNLTSNDFEVALDAAGKQDEWQTVISKNNLVSINPDVDLSRSIKRVSHPNFPLKLAKLVSEKIPVLVTAPIGEAPKGYQFLDVWPYHLTATVSGTEDQIKKLKLKGLKLTINLSQIKPSDLDSQIEKQSPSQKHEVSFMVPHSWKTVYAYGISEEAIEIDDPDAKQLRIDFIRNDLIPINHSIPISLFFPEHILSSYNPKIVSLRCSNCIEEFQGLFRLKPPVFARGVSPLFYETVKDMMQIVILGGNHTDSNLLQWSIQFVNPRHLEERYISARLSDMRDLEIRDLEPRLREEYLKNKFRSYMNQFQLFKNVGKPLELKFTYENNELMIQDASDE